MDEQLAKALDRKVWLPSGGSLVIDRTEAMTVVDVNTGKYTGSGGNLEQTVTRNNLEAAEEIVRQLRLRDLGGIVVIDFIDMVLESNRELVLRRLTECLGRDRTKHQVAEVTSLGLVQMTRKRVGEGLLEAFSEPCEHCNGRGVIVHMEPVDRKSGGQSGSAARPRTSGRPGPSAPARPKAERRSQPDASELAAENDKRRRPRRRSRRSRRRPRTDEAASAAEPGRPAGPTATEPAAATRRPQPAADSPASRAAAASTRPGDRAAASRPSRRSRAPAGRQPAGQPAGRRRPAGAAGARRPTGRSPVPVGRRQPAADRPGPLCLQAAAVP